MSSSSTSVSYKELLNQVHTFIFDIDGVFTDGSVFIHPNGELIRTLNARDGYAVQLAVRRGYKVAIITGGKSEAVKASLGNLGISDIFLGSSNKLEVFERYIAQHNLDPKGILYMGDDIPDMKVMQHVGVPTCPSDAAEEIKAISCYVSSRAGGKGCVREIVEQVLKLHGHWLNGDAFHW